MDPVVDEQSTLENELSPISQEESTGSLSLELGDVIQLFAPSNSDIHEITAFISYIDVQKIKLIDVATNKFHQLNITEDGKFTDESIVQIDLLSRSEEKGYARQNHLLPKTWVDIYFGGEIPVIISGEITNLDEDMIELTTYPELTVIYINFGYQGIPEDIPIEKIVIREKPESLKKVGSLSLIREQLEEGEVYDEPNEEDNVATVEYLETGESIINVPENVEIDKDIRESLQELYIDANSIVFGERLEEIAQLVEVPEGEQRYGIQTQVNDLMDELLSTIPNSQRTKLVLDNIHLLIERFKELRSKFSKFDSNENIYDMKTVGAYYKPLANHIHNIDRRLQWIVPVVTNRKRIYDVESALDQVDTKTDKSGDVFRAIERVQEDFVKTKTMTYSDTQNAIHEWMKPVDLPVDQETNLITSKILTDLDTIVDNLEDFDSHVCSKSEIVKRKFVVQRYNLGQTKLEEQLLKSGKVVYTRKQMTPNDTISIKSLLMLPFPIYRFSKIELPMTTLMEKSTLHHNYFMLSKLLKKNVEIIPHVIHDLQNELDYEKMEKEDKVEFLTGIHEFTLDKDEQIDQEEKFAKFLEVIIPKTRTFIRLVRKHIKDKVSFLEIVKHLEPFMIYPEDIAYSQYKEIRFTIKEYITEIKKNYEERFKKFSKLRTENYNVSPVMNPILRLLSEKENFADAFFQTYKFLTKEKKNTKLSGQEILYQMNSLDNGLLYLNILTSIMIPLMTPSNLLDAISSPEIDDMTDLEKIKPTNCAMRYLAKKYTSIKDLQKDNNVEDVYFEKEFDDTPYGIMKKYKDKKDKMPPDVFVKFMEEILIKEHDCPAEMAESLAKTLIANKKRVEEGHYAILEIRPTLPESAEGESDAKALENEAEVRKITQYYRRMANNWVKDPDINDDAFIDNNTLFCNISAECFKNTKNSVCEPTDQASIRQRDVAKKNMLSEFDKRVTVSIEELETKLEKNIAYYLKMLKRNHLLIDTQLYKANNLAVTLGSLASIEDLIQSPYLKLRDLILGQGDFTKKQYDICRFVDNYCRDPMIEQLDESPHWMYCKETNTKLFPISIFTLAKTFISGGEYVRKQEEICHSVGILSDDGDSIVDKHSGFVIRKIDFSAEEGFDESGFRITTHEILEKDIGLVSLEGVKKEKKVFESETTEMIYNVFATICNNIDVPTEGIEEFVLRTASEIIKKEVYSEDTYKKKSEFQFKKTGKYFKTTYIDYKGETSIIIISCVLLIAIQTATPSFQPKRTFPGCVRSFSGYPMDGIEDLTGLQYIACVLNKSKSHTYPWKTIEKSKVDVLTKRMKEVLEKNIMIRSDILDMYVNKREFILLNPELVSPEEHNISKWRHFLPPVVEFSVLKKLRNISTEFKADFIEMLKKGSKDQSDSLSVMKSKIVQYGYAIIESINEIVKTKDTILKTSIQIPFLENACCNDKLNGNNPIAYFNEEDSNIEICIRASEQLVSTLQYVRNITTAPLLYHPEFTGLRNLITTNPFFNEEENIYDAIIKYCNLDRNLPIPEEFKVVFQEKPQFYNPKWSIYEKIEFIKKNGRRFEQEDLNQLMRIVYQKNIVNLDSPKPFTQVDALKEILEKLDMMNSNIIAEPLREHLHNVLDKYNPLVMKDTPSDELDALTNYLIKNNNDVYRNIMKFFDEYGNLSDTEYKNLHEFLSNIEHWSLDKPMTQTGTYYDEGLYNVIQFTKNIIQNITKVYPNALLNDSEFYKNVPKHWGLSQFHVNDIQKFVHKYYESIEKFKNDAILLKLLQEVGNRLADINLFVQNIPVHTEVVKEFQEGDKTETRIFHAIFNKSTIYELFRYCFYSTIYEYISCSTDEDLLRADVVDKKNAKRQTIRSDLDAADQLRSQPPDLDESLEEFQEVDVIMTNPEELKTRVCSLLLTFMNIEEENKKAVDLSYDEIKKRTNRSREKEKRDIIKYLGDMSIEQRKVEDNFKKFRLGRWNVGQQAGLVNYDKNTYDRERDELLQRLDEDMDTGLTDVVNEELLDIYELEKLEQAELDAEDGGLGRNEFDITELGENYMDGEYYAEDMDPDDFRND